MNWKLVIRARASRDLQNIHEWYEKRTDGLGDEFLFEFDAEIARLKHNPEICQIYFKRFRQLLTPRFPYRVFYTIDGQSIVIVRVLHTSQEHTRHLE